MGNTRRTHASRRRAKGRSALLALGAALLAASAAGEADGPDWWAVSGGAGEVLAVRERPSASSRQVGEIPPDGQGLRNLGCRGGLSFAQWQTATEAQRERGRRTRWCRVEYRGVTGWVPGWHLIEGAPPSGGHTPGSDRIEARRSRGCGRPPPPTPPSTIDAGGRVREFIAVVPESYDAEVPHTLVFAFHGRTTPNHRARAYFGLESHATRPSLFVYPAALVAADGRFSWYDRGDAGAELRDYAFFDALLEQLSATYCVDLDRVFVVGHSLGASFANSLGCARGSRIRGVGTVAGRVWDGSCSGPVAAMILHNPRDDLVAFEVGLHARDHALAQDGLDPPGRPCEPASLRCECYGPPGTPDPVVWCPHTEDRNGRGSYYPHLWPRETGRVLMEFFEELPSPE